MAVQEITGQETGTQFIGKLNSNFENVEAASQYKGLTMLSIGDSITHGFCPRNYTGHTTGSQLDSFTKLAAERLGMEYVDLGVSNSYVTNNGTDPMCTRVDDTTRMPASADVITFMGGTNDVRNPNTVPLGTMADRGTDTFYGALHTIMQKLYTKYIAGVSVANGKKVKIVICTPVKLLDSSKSSQANTVANNAGVLYDWRGFIAAIKEVAAFYSFPVCDFHNLSGINPHLDRTVHGTESGYTGYYNPYITDGTHPTQEGHEMMADVLVGFIKGLK